MKILPSKSMLNRALVIKSFAPELNLEADSDSDDVRDLRNCLESIESSKTFDIDKGGTTLRFFLARLSRKSGEFRVFAHPELLKRPHDQLIAVLQDLGVGIELQSNHFIVKSMGWNKSDRVSIDCSTSTQFASAVILSSIGLDFDFNLELKNVNASIPYLEMTIEMLRDSGVEVEFEKTIDGHKVIVPADSQARRSSRIEIDLSSAFSLAATYLVGDGGEIHDFPRRSLQADHRFVEILQHMGGDLELEGNVLKVAGSNSLRGIRCDLSSSPDLFPVLASLCALADGESEFTGLGNLRYKESDRVECTRGLLQQVGCRSKKVSEEAFRIYGGVDKSRSFRFDPQHDHRMAMAAGVLKKAGCSIQILDSGVVAKSFPDFWEKSAVSP